MIPENKIDEIRNMLEKSKNPLFYLNEDPDGLCAYLLLSKYIKKGKMILVKSAVLKAEHSFLRKIDEINPDLVVILDEASVEKEFLDYISCPVLWLDHHPVQKTDVNYFNPRIQNPKDDRSTTYWAYQVTKHNLWLAAVGALSDWQLTEITDKFAEEYPLLFSKKIKTPEQGLYETKLGDLVKIFHLLLKGSTTEIRKTVSIISKIDDPNEIIEQTTPRGKYLYKKAEKLLKEYNTYLEKALESKSQDGIIEFYYSPKNTSYNTMLSNELLYKKPKNTIIVIRDKDGLARISLRSPVDSKVIFPPIIEKATEGLPGANGGGHDHASGLAVKSQDLDIFLKRFKKEVKETKQI
tara:strand:+ start:3205 stop:4260 length:1056 start_codon:yes stop_codon:yes gene_type:complete